MFRKLFVLTSLILMFGVVSSVSADIHWDGSADSEWTNLNNWETNVVPGINDKPAIGYHRLSNAAIRPVIDSAVPDVGFLSIAGSTLTVSDGGSIHANSAGAMNGEGNMGNTADRGRASLLMSGNSTVTIDGQFAVARYEAVIKLQGAGTTLNAYKFKLGTTGRRNGVTGTDGSWYRVSDTSRTGPGIASVRGGTLNMTGGEFYMYEWDLAAKAYYANGGGPEDGLFTGTSPYVVKGVCDDREGGCTEGDDYAGGENYTDLLPDGVYPGFLGADHYSNLIDIGDGLVTIKVGDDSKSEIDATVDRCIGEGTIRAWGNISGTGGYSVVKTWMYTDTVLHLTAIPEPATIALLGLGGLALLRRKR